MEFDFKLRVLKFKTQKAFTLIEVLVVVAIIIILSVMIMANYRLGEKELALQRSANKLAQDIKRAQGMATSTKEHGGVIPPGGYGVYLNCGVSPPCTGGKPTCYILFADLDNNQAWDLGEEVGDLLEFEKGVQINSLIPNSPLTITFTPPDPTVHINQNPMIGEAKISLRLEPDSGSRKSITVNKAGLIEVTK